MVRRHKRPAPGELLRTRAAQGPYYVEEALNNKVTANIYNTVGTKVMLIMSKYRPIINTFEGLDEDVVSSDDTSI